MEATMKVNFCDTECSVETSAYKYRNGSTHLQLWCDEGPVATASVASPDYIPEPGNVLIKNYAENEGVYEALYEAKVVGPIIRQIPVGWAYAIECKLLI
jgi:hypothetical protein